MTHSSLAGTKDSSPRYYAHWGFEHCPRKESMCVCFVAYNNNRAGSQGDGITWALCRTIFKADRNVEVNTIAQGLRLPASTRELFVAADDHKKNAIYVALPEMVVLFLSPALMSRGCSIFRTILCHFPTVSPPKASRGHGPLLVGCLYTRGLPCERLNPPSLSAVPVKKPIMFAHTYPSTRLNLVLHPRPAFLAFPPSFQARHRRNLEGDYIATCSLEPIKQSKPRRQCKVQYSAPAHASISMVKDQRPFAWLLLLLWSLERQSSRRMHCFPGAERGQGGRVADQGMEKGDIYVRHPLPTLARGGAPATPTNKPSLANAVAGTAAVTEGQVKPRVVVEAARRAEGTLVNVAFHACLWHGTWSGVIIVGVVVTRMHEEAEATAKDPLSKSLKPHLCR